MDFFKNTVSIRVAPAVAGLMLVVGLWFWLAPKKQTPGLPELPPDIQKINKSGPYNATATASFNASPSASPNNNFSGQEPDSKPPVIPALPKAAPSSNTPASAFESYKQSLLNSNPQPYLDLLTKQSQTIVNGAASLRQREYNDLQGLAYTIKSETANTATAQFNPQSPTVPPYFLKQENGQWKVDLYRMSQTYIFDSNNNWHINN
jgi:hypothetical protein